MRTVYKRSLCTCVVAVLLVLAVTHLPVMPVAAWTFNPFTGMLDYYQTATAANGFTNVNGSLTFVSTPTVCLTGAIPYTQWSAIASPSGQGTRIFTVPAAFIFQSARVDVTTPFTSGSGTVTNVSVAIGSSGNPVGWMSNFQVLPTPSPTYNESAGGIGLFASASTGDVFVQATVTNGTPGNLTNLTAGALTTTVCGIVY